MNNLELVRHDCSQQHLESISQEELINEEDILRNKLMKAARQGFFYLKMPEDCAELIPAAMEFGNKFYLSQAIINRPHIGWTGYNKNENQQREALFVEESEWKNWYPNEVATLAIRMQSVALIVLKNLLVALEIPEEKWSVATGEAINDKGLRHFSFNHYRSTEDKIGCLPHRDFGLLTFLYFEKGGLEAIIDGEWAPVSPKKGYFVINISKALEVFVNNKEKVNAAWHRVVKVNEDRISFGLFSDGGLMSPVYKQEKDGSLSIVSQTYKEFAEDSFKDLFTESELVYAEKA